MRYSTDRDDSNSGPAHPDGMRFAFYGRVSTEDHQGPEASRGWQFRRARALIEPRGGRIVAEFFDIDKSRSIPWIRRPHASALLQELKDPGRAFDAAVIGEPHRAFYGNQYSLTYPLFEHYGVTLWVPEVGGPIDPANEAHDMIMGVFGGLSKGERNRIKIRVRASMAAVTCTEGGFLGGRPPYGYRLVDAGPHPNPAKAADGKRMRRLAIDECAATIVQRIFAEFLGLGGNRERGFFAIASGLTRDGVPCPAAHDPARNRHRAGASWSKATVRTILMNPRYTGYQVWNKQRKDEVLLDVEDVSLGHTTKLRWNPRDRWVFSDKTAHPAIIDTKTFDLAQSKRRRPQTGKPKHHHTKRCYPLKGTLWCGICKRKMHTHHSGQTTYYRCRVREQDQPATDPKHPRNVHVREDLVLPELNKWLNLVLTPDRITERLTAMLQAPEMDRRETKQVEPVLSSEEIAALVQKTDDLRTAILHADPREAERLYERVGLRMSYSSGDNKVQAEVRFTPDYARYPGVTVHIQDCFVLP